MPEQENLPVEIREVCTAVLDFAREKCGDEVTAPKVDLRLWMAATLIHSACQVADPLEIRSTVDKKLMWLREKQRSADDDVAGWLGFLND